MKIEFENDKEKEVLVHILKEWLIYNNDYDDVLGCEPACRNPSSPGCDYCIEENLKIMLDKNQIKFLRFCVENWLLDCTIVKSTEPKG